MSIYDGAVPTEEFNALSAFRPESGSVFISARSGEDRSLYGPTWEQDNPGVRFLYVESQERDTITFGGRLASEGGYGLRARRRLVDLLAQLNADIVYLDITALQHSSWAALLRAWLSTDVDLRVVYREPATYNSVASPVEGQLFHLSDNFRGVEPLPGFACMSIPENMATCFMPLLGFEGPRLARLLEHLDAVEMQVVPVVGVPGFRPDYPYNAYLGNRLSLAETGAALKLRYAKANCPFTLLYLLEEIVKAHPWRHYVVGMIGTKPHALGAVLLALRSLAPVELLHDHPTRAAKRTSGSDRILVYHVSRLEYPGLR